MTGLIAVSDACGEVLFGGDAPRFFGGEDHECGCVGVGEHCGGMDNRDGDGGM